MFSRVPALRLLLPMIAGIIVGSRVKVPILAGVVLAATLALFFACEWAIATPSGRRRLTLWRYPMLATAIMAMAMWLTWLHEPAELPQSSLGKGTLTGRIESIRIGTKSMDMRVKLLSCHAGNQLEDLSSHDATVKLTTRGCDYTLQSGDLLAWQAQLEPIANQGNPDEADYAAIERGRGVIYNQHLEQWQWTRIGERPTLTNRLDRMRSAAEVAILSTNLDHKVQYFLVALLLGNDEFIAPETRQEFATAGVAHVLALSGLHVGIIAMMIYFFLFPLDYFRLRKLRLVITLVLLVGYDMLTGLSPSVVRATLMFAFVVSPLLLHRRAVPLNSLAMAAIIILTFAPGSLFNAGFQLSFTTVMFILLFSEKIKEYAPSRPWLAVIYTTIATTMVATVSTLLLSAYYFHNINYGGAVVANALILPVFPVFMVAGVLFMLLTLWGVELQWLETVLEAMYDALEWVVRSVNNLGLHASMGFDVSGTVVILYFVALLLIAAWVYSNRRRYLLWSLAMVPLMLGHGIYSELTTPRAGLVIFNSPQSTPILYYRDHRAWLWVPDAGADSVDTEAFRMSHADFMARRRIESIVAIDTARVAVPGGVFNPPFAMLEGKKMMAVGGGRWKRTTLRGTPPELDMLIVTKRYHGDVATLRRLFKTKRYVLAGDIYHSERDVLRQQLDTSPLPYHDISRQGAVVVER